MSKKKTHIEYVQELKEKRPDVKVIGIYSGKGTPILHKCKCGNEKWLVTPNDVLKGRCCLCNKYRNENTKTYKDKLKIKRPDIEVLGEYVDSKTPILHRCSCGNDKWLVRPDWVQNKKNPTCTQCNGINIPYTTQEYIDKLKIIRPDVKVLGEYVNNRKPILHKCPCGNDEWLVRPDALLRSNNINLRCLICNGKRKRSTEDYIIELKNFRPDVKLIGEYINSETPIEHLCSCGNIWFVAPMNILFKKDLHCMHCIKSKGETKINEFLDIFKISYKTQYRFKNLKGVGNRNLKFDFGILNKDNSLNCVIEYQGEQHYFYRNGFQTYEGHQQQLEHDRRKREYCKENNIRLIEIPYWDFDNIENILQIELKDLIEENKTLNN